MLALVGFFLGGGFLGQLGREVYLEHRLRAVVGYGGVAVSLSAEDVLEEYGIKPMAEERKAVTPAELSFEQELIHRLLMAGERTYDELAELTGFDAGMLNSTLTAMEFSGIIKQSPGRVYSI